MAHDIPEWFIPDGHHTIGDNCEQCDSVAVEEWDGSHLCTEHYRQDHPAWRRVSSEKLWCGHLEAWEYSRYHDPGYKNGVKVEHWEEAPPRFKRLFRNNPIPWNEYVCGECEDRRTVTEGLEHSELRRPRLKRDVGTVIDSRSDYQSPPSPRYQGGFMKGKKKPWARR